MTVIAIANQKGGCGKTTTAINLAASLGEMQHRILLIDMDPQGHASLGLGRCCEDVAGLYEVFTQDLELGEVILHNVAEGVDLVPATISLAAVEHLLADLAKRERQLDIHLDPIRNNYDYIIIDCPPALSLLAFNALRCADMVLVPIEMSLYSLDGIERLQETVELVADKYQLDIPLAILPTMVDYRTRFTRNVLREIQEHFAEEILKVCIHYTVRLKEAAWHGKPITVYAPKTLGAADYQRLADEIVHRTATVQFTRDLALLEEHITRELQVQVIPEEEETLSTAQARPVPAREARSEAYNPDDELTTVTLRFSDIPTNDLKIAGDFNNWIPDHNVETRIDQEAIVKTMKVKPGTYQYRLIIDGKWQEDPNNPNRISNLFGEINSLLKVTENEVPATV
ncbi:MAG TPA: hypothetical protein ENJ22_00200 [Gammaproteobacteria bacterium]|nr:hypothetical protein [Gammaproteobacteria bacterium]